MAKEKAMERKEQAAERAERRFLAEEEQETKNRDAKAAAARRVSAFVGVCLFLVYYSEGRHCYCILPIIRTAFHLCWLTAVKYRRKKNSKPLKRKLKRLQPRLRRKRLCSRYVFYSPMLRDSTQPLIYTLFSKIQYEKDALAQAKKELAAAKRAEARKVCTGCIKERNTIWLGTDDYAAFAFAYVHTNQYSCFPYA